MPRPVSSNEPIGITHLPPPTSSTPPPNLSSSLTQLSSPPPSTPSAWWQWDELSALQQQSKDDLNLNMSVEYSLRRQQRHHTLLPPADYETDAPVGVFGFMDESMKNDGFVPILFEERSISAAAQSTTQPSATTAPDTASAAASASPSSAVLPSAGGTFQTIASVSAPSVGKPSSSGLLDGESGEFICPCCGVRTAGGMSYHGHVTQCYMSRFLNPSRSQPSSPRPDSRTVVAPAPVSPVLSGVSGAPSAATIQSLRECVSQLGLHTRLSMMEAFFRLSRSTATAETTDTPQPFPVEEKLISLLYSPAPQAPSPPLTSASPTSVASSSSLSYRYSPDIDRPFSPASYSSQPTEHHLDALYPHTPAQSPPRSPHTPHTCLTPALHQWGVDEEKGESSLSTFSLHDGHQAYHYGNASDQQQGSYTSAPSSPSPAVKRARALSQPAIPYFDDLHTPASHYQPQPSMSMTSPTMRSYSPVQVHTHHYSSPSTSASSSSSSSSSAAHHASSSQSHLVAPVPLSAGRRHSTGTNRTRQPPKSSKQIFQPQPQQPHTPSTSGSSYLHTPRSTYGASSVLNATDESLGSPVSSNGASEGKGRRRKRASGEGQ